MIKHNNSNCSKSLLSQKKIQKASSDTNICPSQIKNKESCSKQSNDNLSNSIFDIFCPKCKLQIPYKTASRENTKHFNNGILYQSKLVANDQNDYTKKSSLKKQKSKVSLHNRELTLILFQPTTTNFNKLNEQFKSPSQESISADEYVYLTPVPNCNKTKMKEKRIDDSKLFLNLKVKDEIKIDLGNKKSESLDSLLNYEKKQIYPIEELTESSKSSVNERRQKEIKKQEQVRTEQISKILAFSIAQSNKRPPTRKTQDLTNGSFKLQMQNHSKKYNEVASHDQKSFNSPFSIERYLCEEELPLEITDVDLLLDKSITENSLSSISAYPNSARSFDKSSYSTINGCCIAKCFNFFKRICAYHERKQIRTKID